jgi:sulfite exporter TauE/SafE
VQVTLSVAALALTSGSDLSGGATMAMFVLGTSSLFALLGYAARRAATAWRGRLTVLTGLA